MDGVYGIGRCLTHAGRKAGMAGLEAGSTGPRAVRYTALQYIAMQNLELKKGSAELMILSLLDQLADFITVAR